MASALQQALDSSFDPMSFLLTNSYIPELTTSFQSSFTILSQNLNLTTNIYSFPALSFSGRILTCKYFQTFGIVWTHSYSQKCEDYLHKHIPNELHDNVYKLIKMDTHTFEIDFYHRVDSFATAEWWFGGDGDTIYISDIPFRDAWNIRLPLEKLITSQNSHLIIDARIIFSPLLFQSQLDYIDGLQKVPASLICLGLAPYKSEYFLSSHSGLDYRVLMYWLDQCGHQPIIIFSEPPPSSSILGSTACSVSGLDIISSLLLDKNESVGNESPLCIRDIFHNFHSNDNMHTVMFVSTFGINLLSQSFAYGDERSHTISDYTTMLSILINTLSSLEHGPTSSVEVRSFWKPIWDFLGIEIELEFSVEFNDINNSPVSQRSPLQDRGYMGPERVESGTDKVQAAERNMQTSECRQRGSIEPTITLLRIRKHLLETITDLLVIYDTDEFAEESFEAQVTKLRDVIVLDCAADSCSGLPTGSRHNLAGPVDIVPVINEALQLYLVGTEGLRPCRRPPRRLQMPLPKIESSTPPAASHGDSGRDPHMTEHGFHAPFHSPTTPLPLQPHQPLLCSSRGARDLLVAALTDIVLSQCAPSKVEENATLHSVIHASQVSVFRALVDKIGRYDDVERGGGGKYVESRGGGKYAGGTNSDGGEEVNMGSSHDYSNISHETSASLDGERAAQYMRAERLLQKDNSQLHNITSPGIFVAMGEVHILIFVLHSQLNIAQQVVQMWRESCANERTCLVYVRYSIQVVPVEEMTGIHIYRRAHCCDNDSESQSHSRHCSNCTSSSSSSGGYLARRPSLRSSFLSAADYIDAVASRQDIVVILVGLEALFSFPQPAGVNSSVTVAQWRQSMKSATAIPAAGEGDGGEEAWRGRRREDEGRSGERGRERGSKKGRHAVDLLRSIGIIPSVGYGENGLYRLSSHIMVGSYGDDTSDSTDTSHSNNNFQQQLQHTCNHDSCECEVETRWNFNVIAGSAKWLRHMLREIRKDPVYLFSDASPRSSPRSSASSSSSTGTGSLDGGSWGVRCASVQYALRHPHIVSIDSEYDAFDVPTGRKILQRLSNFVNTEDKKENKRWTVTSGGEEVPECGFRKLCSTAEWSAQVWVTAVDDRAKRVFSVDANRREESGRIDKEKIFLSELQRSLRARPRQTQWEQRGRDQAQLVLQVNEAVFAASSFNTTVTAIPLNHFHCYQL